MAEREYGVRGPSKRVWRMPNRETAVDGMFPNDELMVRDRVKPRGTSIIAETEWGPWRPADTEEADRG